MELHAFHGYNGHRCCFPGNAWFPASYDAYGASGPGLRGVLQYVVHGNAARAVSGRGATCGQESQSCATDAVVVRRWIQLQRKTLSKHAEMAKAFDYILNHWNALNEFCRDGWVEIDNNIGENALRSVAVGRKNYLFFGSDKGGESAAIIYSLLVTCKLNGVEPEDWLREVIRKINDWPSNRVHELLPWNLSAVK